MITLKALWWSNCFSYGEDNYLDLCSSNVMQLIGINGTGKSSIPIILEEVYYNKNSKGFKKAEIPNRRANAGYEIKTWFSVDEDEYEIHVNRKTALKVVLLKNGEDISSHTATGTYKTIQEILGVDFKTFSSLIYQNPKTGLQILTATDTNRKKFIIDLMHLEEYVRLFEVFKEAARDANTEVTKIESSVATIEKWLSDNKLTNTTILPMLNLDIETEDDEKELRHLTTELSKIQDTNRKISKNNSYKQMLEAIDVSVFQNPEVSEKVSYDELQSRLGEHQAQQRQSERVIKKYSQLTGKCHTCGQDVDQEWVQNTLSMAEADIAVQQAAISDLLAEINEVKENNNKYDQIKRTEEEWVRLWNSIDLKLPEELLDKEALETKANEIQTRITQAREQIREVERENQRRTQQNTRIEVVLEQTEEFQKQLDVHLANLGTLSRRVSHLEVLKKAFSTNGLLAYKIENLIKDLEELANEYLAELTGGQFTIEFILQNDKLNVVLTDDGDEISPVALSSGQESRVNTALLLAIRKLMSSISKSRINVLFLDEVISVLDDEGKEKLVEILLKEENLNTFTVSHGWSHPLLEQINVLMDETKTSRLEK